MTSRISLHTAATTLAVFAVIPFAGNAEGIVQNEDNTHFFVISEPGVGRRELTDHIDRYLVPGHQITEFFLNPGSWMFSFEGKYCQAAWKNMTFEEDGTVIFNGKPLEAGRAKLYRVMKQLHDDGINPYQVWIEHLRKRDVSPWISQRMNDIHDPFTPGATTHSDFWLAHPEWRMDPWPNFDNWQAAGLDYGIPEVREHAFAQINELIETFDADGFELDFQRFGQVFRHGEEIRNQPIMTEFIRRVRRRLDEKAAAQKRDRIKLAIRVAVDPRDVYRLGFDIETIVREGLIDMLIAAPIFHSSPHDVPVAEWKRLLGDKVLFAVGIESQKRSHWNFVQSGYGDPGDVTRGLAAAFLAQGADRIYLFNHFWYPRDVMTTAGRLETATATTRRHPVLYNDYRAAGNSIPPQLPQKVLFQRARPYRINIGPLPKENEAALVVLAFKDGNIPAGDFADIYVNSRKLEKRAPAPKLFFKPELNAATAAFVIPAGYLNPGENLVEVFGLSPKPFQLDWIEIAIVDKAYGAPTPLTSELDQTLGEVDKWLVEYNAANGMLPGSLWNPGGGNRSLVTVDGAPALRFDNRGDGTAAIASLRKEAVPEIFSAEKIAVEMTLSLPAEGEKEKAPWNLYFAFAGEGGEPAAFSFVMNRSRCSGSFGEFAFPALPTDKFFTIRMVVDNKSRKLTLQIGDNDAVEYTDLNAAIAPGQFALGDGGNSVGRIFDLKSLRVGIIR